MKKTLIIILLILSVYCCIGKKMEKVEIPAEAIRIRVIANSNSEYDQSVKNNIKDDVSTYLYKTLENVGGIELARKTIILELPALKKIISNKLSKEGYSFNINYGYNYFPPKEYKDVVYNEGYYESLVVTLGEGLGDNWWCVLFPPLCFIEAKEDENITYSSFVGELIEKYM